VIHRDIHTSNVMIDFECAPKTRPVVRLLDLGMCELLPEFYARIYRYGTPPEHRVVLGTGGLSHQLDGERAGFINKDFDLAFMESLLHDPRWATQFDSRQLVEKAGTQGIELLMWLAARAALGERVSAVHRNYHIPISNTAAATVLMTTEHALVAA
jgi:protocatechuate 4,5-dioxygenase beta chain